MNWRRDELPTHVRAMANRPRHEALRGHITAILHHGFHAAYEATCLRTLPVFD